MCGSWAWLFADAVVRCRLKRELKKAMTVMRQTCCHPHIARQSNESMGKSRKSLRQIVATLLEKSITVYDQVHSFDPWGHKH